MKKKKGIKRHSEFANFEIGIYFSVGGTEGLGYYFCFKGEGYIVKQELNDLLGPITVFVEEEAFRSSGD